MQRDWPESDTGVDGERETEMGVGGGGNGSCAGVGRKELEETE